MQQTPDSLQDLDTEGRVVKSRISNPQHAIEIASRLLLDDQIRSRRREKVNGNIDGNAPLDPAKVKAAGREGDSNYNWREGKGQLQNAWTPYYDLTIEIPICIDGDLDYSGNADDDLMRGFAGEFHKLVFGWRGFDRMVQTRDWAMLKDGVGVISWQDKWDFRPKPILYGNFYVPDETDSDLENLELAMVTSRANASYLWHMIEDEKHAEAAGWNIESTKQTIMSSARNDSYLLTYQWDKWQQAFKNGDVYVSCKQTKQIDLGAIFVKEMDGKISMHLIPLGNNTQRNEFLFSQVGMFDSWDECLQAFPYDIGSDGTYHSIKALGMEIYAYCQLSNRIKNSLADLAITGIKPMFQPKSGSDAKEFQMIRMGGYNILPAGIDSVQVNVQGNLQQALAVSQSFEQVLNKNTGTYHEAAIGNPGRETAKAATLKAAERGKLTKGAYNRHYRCMDRMYAEMWRRATNPAIKSWHPGGKEALKFQAACYKLCDKYGVPHDALQKVDNIRATRSIGLGSAAIRLEVAEGIMDQFDKLGPVGQNNALRMYFANLTSFHSVDALVPSISEGEIMTQDDSIAALENNALNSGGEALITPKQNHVIHLKHHVESMEEDAKAVQQGADIKMIFQRLEAKGMHSHEHLNEIEKNPVYKKPTGEYKSRLQQLSRLQDQLQQNIEEQDQANPPQEQGQPDPEMAKVQGELELKKQKLAADMQLRKEKQDAMIQLKAQHTQAEIMMKDASNAAAMRNRNTQ